MTAAEVEAIKGEKTLLGGLKGVTHKEFKVVNARRPPWRA